MAPEFYENLKFHPSWSLLLFQFIFDKRYTLFSRIERMKRAGQSIRSVPEVPVGASNGVDLSARPINF